MSRSFCRRYSTHRGLVWQLLASRLRVRVDDQPCANWQWRLRVRNDPGRKPSTGEHTVTVEPVGGPAAVHAFRLTKTAMAGIYGTILSSDYSELLTDVRVDIFHGQRLVQLSKCHPRTGDFEFYALAAGDTVSASWRPAGNLRQSRRRSRTCHRLDVGTIVLKRERALAAATHRISRYRASDVPYAARLLHGFGESSGRADQAGTTAEPLQNVDLSVTACRKLPIGRWNDVGEATFKLPKEIPWDMYDLVLSFDTKQGEVRRLSGQAVCVRPPLPDSFHVAGCGHMNTWGQQTAEYLARVAEVAELAGARTMLIANEVNAAYVSGALLELRIPYVATAAITRCRCSEFWGLAGHDDGPMRIVDFGRWPYESWTEVESLFPKRQKATNRVIVCYESFAPIGLIKGQNIKLLFDAHTDEPHADAVLPPRTFQMRRDAGDAAVDFDDPRPRGRGQDE